MDLLTLGLFAATVLPLIFTPGPDVLLVASQGLSSGGAGVIRAVAGILTGYTLHGVLAAIGVAALVAASPLLFALLRWAGVAYLAYLAVRMLQAAWSGPAAIPADGHRRLSILRGFLTSFLNPKGLLMYLSVLPQFIDPTAAVAPQALALSALFVALCGVVYTTIGFAVATATRQAGLSVRQQRWLNGLGGALLALAAGRLATT